VLATSLLATGSASADRGVDHFAALDRATEEYVLGDFTPEQGARLFFIGQPADSGPRSGGTTDYVQAGSPSNGGIGGPDDFKAGVGCSIQCITSGVAYGRGPDALLVVKTDTLARIWIHVTGPNGYERVMNSGADEVMEFKAFFDDLEAGTTYQAWAEAKDTQNYESEAHGKFTTLERNVEISYAFADLIERAYGSDAKFDMDVWLDGSFDEDLDAYNMVAEGYTLGLGINSIQLDDVGQYLDFAIQLYEAPDYCNNVGNIDEVYFGPGSCSFLSFAELLEGDNDLDARPADADSWTEWTLHPTMERPAALWPPYDDELLFTVDVTLHVTYTPRPF
jgi:hypothetical protein